MNWKKYILILIFLLIGIASGGILILTHKYYWQTSKQELKKTFDSEKDKGFFVNWKTYNNKEIGFEIKYPPDWLVLKENIEGEDSLDKSIVFTETRQKEKRERKNKCKIGIYIYSNNKGLSLYDWVVDHFWGSEKKEDDKISEIKINDLKGLKYELSIDEEVSVLFSRDDKIINIRGNSDCRDYPEIFNKILSTFKFIQRTPVTIISIEFSPELSRSEYGEFTYRSGTKLIIKGKNLIQACLALSGGPGIKPQCSSKMVVSRKIDELNILEFTLNQESIICHRLSDFHEVHFFDENGELMKIVSCEEILQKVLKI